MEVLEEGEEINSDETEENNLLPFKTCLTQVSQDVVMRINRVNIHESPILACIAGTRTVYVLLDTGATASIITQKMATLLNLSVHKAGHESVQVERKSQLPVLGEVHTTFTRGSLTFHFSGLVVSRFCLTQSQVGFLLYI